MLAADLCLKSLQGQGTLFVEQNSLLDKLSHDLKDMVEIRGPHDSTGRLCIADEGIVVSSRRTEKEVFTVMREYVITFPSNCSVRTKNDIQKLEYSEFCTVMSVVRRNDSLRVLQSERTSNRTTSK